HTGHPVYQELLAAWESKCNALANDRLFAVAALIAVELTIGDAERAAISRKKRIQKIAGHLEWQDNPELLPEEKDKIYYIKYICCASPEDLKEFYEAVAMRSQPTEAAVERHKATFQGDVQGPVDLGV